MEITRDWFSHNIPNMTEVMSHIGKKQDFLEIGSFEGLSAAWFLQQMQSHGTLVCVDSFVGIKGTKINDWGAVRERFNRNTNAVRLPTQTLEVIEDMSTPALAKLICTGRSFDFIYVDAGHSAASVLTDACQAFELLRPGGIMTFDDYLWTNSKVSGGHHQPKLGIDGFTAAFYEQIKIIQVGYQITIQKILSQ
jgi:predicted O-methyltransferase YrrM